MRTTDERIFSVERRVKELQQKKSQRQYYYISLSAVAACLIIIVGIGFSMPDILEGFSGGHYNNTLMMASIFYEGKAIGYVLIGLLAFALGVCLTILCFRLQPGRQRGKEKQKNDRNY